MNYQAKLLTIIAFAAMGLSSCKEDYFDPDDYRDMVQASFPVEQVDPQHTWTTMKSVDVKMTVHGDYNQVYKVGVYLENPLGSETLTKLYSRSVPNGSTVYGTFSCPAAQDHVYVALFDDAGRREAQMVRIDDGHLEVSLGVGSASSARGTRASEADFTGSYAKTFEQMLNPSVSYCLEYINQFPGQSTASWMANQNYLQSTSTVTLAEMQAYATFTDADLEQNTFQTLTNQVTVPGKQGGVQYYNTTYAIEVGYSPADGAQVPILCNGTHVGTLTYGGSGGPAVADASQTYNGFSARLSRNSYSFTAAKTGTLTFYHMAEGASKFLSIKKDGNYLPTGWYEGSYYQNMQWWNTDIGINVEAGHTYQVYFENNQTMDLYGLKFYYQEVEEATPQTTRTLGDGSHFRVASGTEITKIFHVNAQAGVINDKVIYIEGKVHLQGNTLNGVTIVVANGGEIVVDENTSFSNCGRLLVMAGGKVTGTSGKYLYVNNGMPNYNAGTINTNGELNLNGSDFYNCGTVTVDKLRNTSGGRITNFGSITARCNEIAADAYNCVIVNGCYMHYTEDAGIGRLTMLPSSRLDVDGVAEFTMSWETAFDASTPDKVLAYEPASPNILMDKAVVNVGTAYVNNTVFQGPSTAGQYAIVKMQKVQAANGTDLMQRENCYFDWDITELYTKGSYRGDTNDNTKYKDIPEAEKASNPYGYRVDFYRGHLSKFVSEATAPSYMSIPASQCTGAGYNPDGNPGGPVPEETGLPLRYCFEDNYPEVGDYDFNDVVLTLTPTVSSTTVSLRVSLDAVGAMENVSAALRISGLTDAEVTSFTASGDFDADYPFTKIIYSTETLLPANMKQGGLQDVVLTLFNSAHWAMGRAAKTQGLISSEYLDDGSVRNWFYNTVAPDNTTWVQKVNGVVAPEVTYTFELSSEEAAAKFTEANLDVFIVEEYNGAYWEVHTVPFKHDQVLDKYYSEARNAYTDNFPWAICVPGDDFKYPIEWQPIGFYRNGELTGAYKEQDHSFGQWAHDHTQSLDWYKYPTSGLVYE